MLTIPDVNIVRIPTGTEATSDMQVAHERLFAEFNLDHPPKVRNLQPLLDNNDAALIVAISGDIPESSERWTNVSFDRYLGALTLLFIQTLTQDLAQIPHVAVDHEHQGRGIGSGLVRKALAECALRNISRLELTSGHSKLAAHAMYRRLGFQTRDTVNWRYNFKRPA